MKTLLLGQHRGRVALMGIGVLVLALALTLWMAPFASGAVAIDINISANSKTGDDAKGPGSTICPCKLNLKVSGQSIDANNLRGKATFSGKKLKGKEVKFDLSIDGSDVIVSEGKFIAIVLRDQKKIDAKVNGVPAEIHIKLKAFDGSSAVVRVKDHQGASGPLVAQFDSGEHNTKINLR